MGQLREDYIDTGKVKFVYMHMVQAGEALRAAEASECAAEQSQFWAYHDAAYASQIGERRRLNDETLIALAGEIGLDTDSFAVCLESGKYADWVHEDRLALQSIGARGTPGFLIDGAYLAGSQSYEMFVDVIEQKLAEAAK